MQEEARSVYRFLLALTKLIILHLFIVFKQFNRSRWLLSVFYNPYKYHQFWVELVVFSLNSRIGDSRIEF